MVIKRAFVVGGIGEATRFGNNRRSKGSGVAKVLIWRKTGSSDSDQASEFGERVHLLWGIRRRRHGGAVWTSEINWFVGFDYMINIAGPLILLGGGLIIVLTGPLTRGCSFPHCIYGLIFLKHPLILHMLNPWSIQNKLDLPFPIWVRKQKSSLILNSSNFCKIQESTYLLLTSHELWFQKVTWLLFCQSMVQTQVWSLTSLWGEDLSNKPSKSPRESLYDAPPPWTPAFTTFHEYWGLCWIYNDTW